MSKKISFLATALTIGTILLSGCQQTPTAGGLPQSANNPAPSKTQAQQPLTSAAQEPATSMVATVNTTQTGPVSAATVNAAGTGIVASSASGTPAVFLPIIPDRGISGTQTSGTTAPGAAATATTGPVTPATTSLQATQPPAAQAQATRSAGSQVLIPYTGQSSSTQAVVPSTGKNNQASATAQPQLLNEACVQDAIKDIQPGTFPVAAVDDGGSFLISFGNQSERILYSDVSAPSAASNQPDSQQALAANKSLVEGKTVVIYVIGENGGGNGGPNATPSPMPTPTPGSQVGSGQGQPAADELAYVYVDGKLVNNELLQSGTFTTRQDDQCAPILNSQP